MSTEHQSNLYTFEDATAPEIHCKRWIPHPVNVEDMVGTVGYDAGSDRRCGLFLHRRKHDGDRRRTYNAQFDGYAISEWVLDVLRQLKCYSVFIAVTDAGELLEFDLRQYETGIAFEWRAGDPQRCVPQEQAKHVWDSDEVGITDPDDTARLSIESKHLAGKGMN